MTEQGELQPQFWQSFTNALGCAPDHLYAWNKEDSIGIDLFLYNPFVESQERSSYEVDLSEPGNRVTVETGRSISTNFCVTEIQVIPVRRVYEATAGHVEVVVDHKNGLLGATLRDVNLSHPPSGHRITVSDLHFPLQPLYVRKE